MSQPSRHSIRVIYFGTSVFAIPALRAVADHVVLVVSQPDRPSGRGQRLHPSPISEVARELGLPLETPEKSRAPEFVEHLRSFDADLLLVAAYGQILSVRQLESARQGGINLHGSLLPEYRGAAPIQRCIQDGRTESGVTLMQMDKGMDTGDEIARVALPIGPDETYGELQDRLAIAAAELAADWLPRLAAGDYVRTPQDASRATHAAKVEKAEAQLQFEKPYLDEYNRFRAFTPSPGAFLVTRAGALKLSAVRSAGPSEQAPGTVVQTSPAFTVSFEGGALELLEVQPEGKKRMTGRDFANGARLRPGDSLIP